MKKDFTISSYKDLLETALENHYKVLNFQDYYFDQNKHKKIIILRHDVDKKPQNSLQKAKIEAEFNISSTYYFRSVPQSYNENIIKEIVDLEHEIGYHYEDLSRANGDYKLAIKKFEQNLKKLRKFYPVKTICMHGSPLSKWDNKKLWEKYNYKKYDIIAEPYLDIDFDEVLYITDTGRSWNNQNASIRDKVYSRYNYNFKSTQNIIDAFKNGDMPDKIMINTHPQRWNDNYFEWCREYVTQSVKNVIKRLIINRTK